MYRNKILRYVITLDIIQKNKERLGISDVQIQK